MSAIRCVVGLGNPGTKYAGTRHNAGFWFVDELARRHAAVLRAENKFSGEVALVTAASSDCWLLKPMTYMNHSGRSVSALCNFYRIPPAGLLVVYDELDLAPGMMRLKSGGGHGGHNGLRSIAEALRETEYNRLRMGVGRPPAGGDVSRYVLSCFSAAERARLQEYLAKATDALEILVQKSPQEAMNLYNNRDLLT